MLSLKNHDLGNLCQKWELRVSHVEKSSVFGNKKKFFCDNLGYYIFKIKIPRGIIYM
jgi:hypothetical protein